MDTILTEDFNIDDPCRPTPPIPSAPAPRSASAARPRSSTAVRAGPPGTRRPRPAPLLHPRAARERPPARRPRLRDRGPRPGLAGWSPIGASRGEVPFMPARVVLQDFTGVPCVVDLAAMRDAMARMKGDPDRINPVVPCDLVIDHSVQVDHYGSEGASSSTSSWSSSGTWSATSSSSSPSAPSRTSGWCRPAPASSTRSTSSTWRRWSSFAPQFGELTAYPDTLVGHRFPHHHDQRARRARAGASAASRRRRSCWASRTSC